MKRKLLAVVMALAFVAATAACGGGDETPATTEPATETTEAPTVTEAPATDTTPAESETTEAP